MKITFYFVLFIALMSCAKHTTPRKVEKKLGEGSWTMTIFIDNEKSILKKYTNVALSFTDGGVVSSTSTSKVSGEWELGDNKNPAVMYMVFPETDSMHVLSDDWIVYSLTKTECVLKRNKGIEDFDYDATLDKLVLTKK